MGASSSTKGMPSNRRKVIAGLAAVGIGLAGYGVYATSLTVAGAAGTSLQAGTSASVTLTAGCDTDGVSVTENFNGGTLNTSDGYVGASRTGFTISGINAACKDKVLSLAIKAEGGDYASAGDSVALTDSGTATVANTGTSKVVGYSVKIENAPA